MTDPAEYQAEEILIIPCRSAGFATETQPGSLEANWTYNLTAMQKAATGMTLHRDEPSCPEFARRLDAMVAALEGDPDRFRALNPENGWGDYDGFLATCRKMQAWLVGRDLEAIEMGWWL
jgi:hypothetical protein